MRRIAHLDMDAFYASVELLKYPELRGQAVVIGGDDEQQPVVLEDGRRQFYRLKNYVGRGVVMTSTYEARALGVFSAMGAMKAAKLAPECVILPTDFDAYLKSSQSFKRAVAKVSPIIEDVGIDEIYIDLTDDPRSDEVIGVDIKRAVYDATGISCSIGIAANKLLAKICSDLDKPDGLTILTEADIPTRIWPLPARKVNGIGPKADQKLNAIGICTIGELARADLTLLRREFGDRYALWLKEVAHGVDQRPLNISPEVKSLSREITFERDLHVVRDRMLLSHSFTELCQRVAEDLESRSITCKGVGIKLKFSDFSVITRDITLTGHTDDAKLICRAGRECLKRVDFKKKIRLLGIRVRGLGTVLERTRDPQQYDLFIDEHSV